MALDPPLTKDRCYAGLWRRSGTREIRTPKKAEEEGRPRSPLWQRLVMKAASYTVRLAAGALAAGNRWGNITV